MLSPLTKAQALRSVLKVGALLKPARQNANVLPSQTADTLTEEGNCVLRIPAHNRRQKYRFIQTDAQ